MTPEQREVIEKLAGQSMFPGTKHYMFVHNMLVRGTGYEMSPDEAEYLEKISKQYNVNGLVCPECQEVIDGLLWRLTRHDQPHCGKCAYKFIFGQRGQLPR